MNKYNTVYILSSLMYALTLLLLVGTTVTLVLVVLKLFGVIYVGWWAATALTWFPLLLMASVWGLIRFAVYLSRHE